MYSAYTLSKYIVYSMNLKSKFFLINTTRGSITQRIFDIELSVSSYKHIACMFHSTDP